jgi:hypothetical protein
MQSLHKPLRRLYSGKTTKELQLTTTLLDWAWWAFDVYIARYVYEHLCHIATYKLVGLHYLLWRKAPSQSEAQHIKPHKLLDFKPL